MRELLVGPIWDGSRRGSLGGTQTGRGGGGGHSDFGSISCIC